MYTNIVYLYTYIQNNWQTRAYARKTVVIWITKLNVSSSFLFSSHLMLLFSFWHYLVLVSYRYAVLWCSQCVGTRQWRRHRQCYINDKMNKVFFAIHFLLSNNNIGVCSTRTVVGILFRHKYNINIYYFLYAVLYSRTCTKSGFLLLSLFLHASE